MTGGLGPASDDLTREITAQVLGLELITDEAALRSLENFFALRGRTMVAANLKQALCPVGADILPNPNGTAPGIYVPPRLNGRTNCALFLLPGPPRELYPMYHAEVVARAMVEGMLRVSGVDIAVSVTGIAGPGRGSEEKPVGKAWLAVEALRRLPHNCPNQNSKDSGHRRSQAPILNQSAGRIVIHPASIKSRLMLPACG